MDDFSVTTNISKPPKVVFAFLVDVTNMTRWYEAVEHVALDPDFQVGRGARFELIRSLPGGPAANVVEITEYVAGPPLALMPATRDLAGAHTWMRDYVDAGVEGVVVKHREHGYRPRRRSWFKVRTRTTADAVVGGVIGSLDAPEALLLGLPDDTGRLRVAGRTSPLTLPARHELGALLVPPRRAHPWPERIPASRFGQLPGDLVDYTPTEPLLVVEVDTDTCFDHQRWRHPTAR